MKKTLFLMLTTLFALSACSPFTLQSNQVLNHADMESYKTYKIQPADQACLAEGMTIQDARNIADAVAKELNDRGYKAVDSNPDMIVYLAISVKQVVETKDALPNSSPYGYRYFGPRASYARSYYSDAKIISDIKKEGVLLMDIVDAAKDRHVYCAEVTAVADGMKVKDMDQLAEAAHVLFSKFPLLPLAK